MKRSLIGLVVLIPNLSMAEVPNVFTPQTAAKAAEVNENFAYLDAVSTANTTGLTNAVTAINGITSELANLVTIGSVENALAALQTNIDNNTTAINGLVTSVNTNASNITSLSDSLAENVSTLSSNFNTSIESLNTSVNENLTALNTRLVAVESAEAPHLALSLGEVSFDVDCSDDPTALLTRYQASLHYSNVNFFLTGACYGDIHNVPDSDSVIQLAGQTILIASKDANQRASIIAHNESGKAQLTTGLSGGLYLQNVDVVAGDSDANGSVLAFGRQSHGNLSGVSVTGDIAVSGSSMITGNDVTLSGDITIENSTVQLTGSNTVSASQFTCSGRSTLDLSDWSKVDDNDSSVDSSTNCVDGATWQAVAQMYLNSLNP